MRHVVAIALAMLAGCGLEPPPTPDDCRVGEFSQTFAISPPYRLDLLFVVDGDDASIAARVVEELALGPMAGGSRLAPVDDLQVVIAGSGCTEAPPLHGWIERIGAGDRDTFLEEVRARAAAVSGCASGDAIGTAARLVEGPIVGRFGRDLAIVVIAPHDDDVDRSSALLAASAELRTQVILLVASDPAIRPWDWDALAASPACDPDAEPPMVLARVGAALDAAGIGASAGSLCGAPVERVLHDVYPWSLGDGCWCVPRLAIPSEPRELAACDMVETLGPLSYARRCDELPGRETLDAPDRCRVVQRDPLYEAPGWRLIEQPDCCGSEATVAFVATEPEPGSTLELRCTTLPATPGCAEPP